MGLPWWHFDHVVPEEEAAQHDIVYGAVWPGGVPNAPGLAPTLIPLREPVPGPRYDHYVRERERMRAEWGVSREEFYEWMRTLGLEMFVRTDGVYRVRYDRKARQSSAENLRSWMWK